MTGFEKYVVEKMVEMKGLLQDVLRRQKETHVRLDQLDKRGAATVPELPADIEFPLSTVADVDSLAGGKASRPSPAGVCSKC